MSHTSPASFLVWAIMSILLGGFLVYHLWSFDRFRCLRWNDGPYSGAFKRVMTYSYLLSVPMIITYATGNAVIKYREGFIFFPPLGIIPKPYQLWDETSKSAILPLLLIFSIAWGLEMVSHLEELCFWYFLVNAGANQQSWFRSAAFKIWVVGSCIAVIYMPLVTAFSRADPLHSEAFTFLAGSLGSLCLTLWFIPILWTFPRFLKNLRQDGVDMATIIRLTKFFELNKIRIVFRCFFVIPLLILGIDGTTPHDHINESMFWTDLLAMLAGFGCVISSGITLVIFFPRSIEGEMATKDAARVQREMDPIATRSINGSFHAQMASSTKAETSHREYYSEREVLPESYSPRSASSPHGYRSNNFVPGQIRRLSGYTTDVGEDVYSKEGMSRDGHSPRALTNTPSQLPMMRPNRRVGEDIELGGIVGDPSGGAGFNRNGDMFGNGRMMTMGQIQRLTERNLSAHNNSEASVSMGERNPVQNFTSPLDFVYRTAEVNPTNTSRLTFSRP
ncbi:hypothetical protein BDN72DRAFT_289768 [Pluteus cervinus]|uniref:Uncharacterized protein n=1 Tax=Pluteus cervinus TaxID=181527 RepID=A0ACD3AF59_9AGAR|nr:hypothetical protein BDN72DRAFT_289768 [Pluteus cervinus]